MALDIVFLDAGTFYGHPDVQQSLARFGNVQLHDHTIASDVVTRIKYATIVLTNKVVLDEATLAQCEQLRLICVTATGMNNIDLAAAKRRGIEVKNASNYSTNSVTQATLSMVLQLLMRPNEHDAFVRITYSHHRFFTHLSPGFHEIAHKTWGIIGTGAIAQKVGKLATALEAKTIYHSPSNRLSSADFPVLPLSELLETSDIISIHTPLNEHSRNLIGSEELSKCKPTAILINVARGGIVNELDLANALKSHQLAGAATDVFQNEPIETENPLLDPSIAHKVLLSAHIAWGSFEARENLMKITCDNIKQWINTQKFA